ncbi:probable glycosyltransferase At5g03795 [Arachis stenosperma]|uniref:probable glycosyltransferase At5g03795 n=1 Tax=Arachis stenosperma TaxID=217475 RepID=UPI0025AC5F30|nr:probable glycosyltransferase At5g03795 [Arachis stenosperma]XP_057722025.1 probable glycosyltransferase At5g03795 [Arachis stenosperma]
MGQEFSSFFRFESKRLLWFIGITFATIVAFQYLELPYGNVLLSLFSAGNIPTSGSNKIQGKDPPPVPEAINNVTIFNQGNVTVESSLETDNRTRVSGANDSSPIFDLEPRNQANSSLGLGESNKSPTVEGIEKTGNVSVGWKEENLRPSSYNNSMGLDLLTNHSGEENVSRPEHESASLDANSTPSMTNVSPRISTKGTSNDSNIPLFQKDKKSNSMKEENEGNTQAKNSATVSMPKENHNSHVAVPEVTTVSEMNKLFLQSHASYRSMRPKWSSGVDQELLWARSEIEHAPIVKNDPDLYGPIYHNVSMFKRSYELMEQMLKVYVYREGARPILHTPFLTGIYASEGWFMKLMEANTRFITNDPKTAHLFYLPFSSRKLEEALYVQGSHSHKNLIQYLHNYVELIAGKHPFWNRTRGADHFLVGCHDWAPSETKVDMSNCIRALCNADVKEGFVFGKDVSLPETHVRNGLNPTRDLGGKSPSKRNILAFFAGKMHGYVRPILLQHWENKDPDMKIFGKLPKSKGDRNYIQYMKSSKYCICAKGYEVNSPRVVEAIFYECVPVIISDNFVPPFLEALNWETFSVIVLEKDIPNLKSILLSIPQKRYLRLQMRVKKVQKHFLWHKNPVKYDIFHMILHSVWYNRVFSAIT